MRKLKLPLIILSIIIILLVAYVEMMKVLDDRARKNLSSVLVRKGSCSPDKPIIIFGKVEGLWEVNCLTPGEPFSVIHYFTSKGDRGKKLYFED